MERHLPHEGKPFLPRPAYLPLTALITTPRLDSSTFTLTTSHHQHSRTPSSSPKTHLSRFTHPRRHKTPQPQSPTPTLDTINTFLDTQDTFPSAIASPRSYTSFESRYASTYNQLTPPWSTLPLSQTQDTPNTSQLGCYLVCLTNILQNNTHSSFTPAHLLAYLHTNSGIYATYNVNPHSMQAFGLHFHSRYTLHKTKPQNHQLKLNSLFNSLPLHALAAIHHSTGIHWVLVARPPTSDLVPVHDPLHPPSTITFIPITFIIHFDFFLLN